MTRLQKLLLVPCLSPLLMAMLVAALNTNQSTSLRFLTWRSNKLPIGAWVALASTGTALLSGLAFHSASAGNQPLRRQVHRPVGWDQPGRGAQAPEPERAPFTPHRHDTEPAATTATVWPERDIRDPSPTVAVPFRVIQRGRQSPPQPSAETIIHSNADAFVRNDDDWDQPVSEDW